MSNTTSINSELFANLVTAAQYAAYEQSVARQMVTVFDAPVNAGKVLQVPVWSAVSAANITDESAASAADTNTTSASITLSEHVVYHRVTDMLRDSAYGDVMAQLGDQSGRAIAESMDSQLFNLFGSLSTNTVGSTGAEITVDSLMQAAAILRTAKLTGPFYAVVHPKVAYNIKKALTATTAYTASGMMADSILSNYFVGQIAGITIVESGLISVDTDGDAVGAVFAPSAFGHAMRGAVGMELQRQAAARATDVVLTGVAGAAILQDAHAVKLVGDATI